MHILFLTDNFPPEVNAPASELLSTVENGFNGRSVPLPYLCSKFPEGEIFEGTKIS